MLIPAFSAMLLGMFFFKNSPIYFKTNKGLSRWFIYYFFSLVFLYVLGMAFMLIQPNMAVTIQGLLLIPSVAGLILLVALRLIGGKETFTSVGMGGGNWKVWLLLGLGVVVYYGLSTVLNYIFKLGTPVDLAALIPSAGGVTLPTPLLLATLVLNTIVIGPILGLIITFGEEYGWRGYLQSELNHLGRVRGTLLLGVIWGVWHWPIIWMGHNYPGQPILGSLLMVGICILLAFFLAYGVFKSKGVWTAAYLHAINNQTASFFFAIVYTPAAMHIAFGIGLLGFIPGLLVLLLILRDPVWKVKD